MSLEIFLATILLFVTGAWIFSVRQARKELSSLRTWYESSVDDLAAVSDDSITELRELSTNYEKILHEAKDIFLKRFRLVHHVVCLSPDEVFQVNKRLEPVAKTLTGGIPLAMLLETNNHNWLLYLIEDCQASNLDMLEDLMGAAVKDITGRRLGDAPTKWAFS